MFTKEELQKQYIETQALRNKVIQELNVTQDKDWRANLFSLDSFYQQGIHVLEIMFFKLTGENIWEY